MSTVPASPVPGPPTHTETRYWLLRVTKAFAVFVYAVVLINLVMLLLGFFLRLLGASTDAEFTRWVYRSVDRIMEPFRGMFPTIEGSGQSVLDVSLLFAAIIYTIAAIAFHYLVVWLADKIIALRRQQAVGRQSQVIVRPAYGPAPGAPGSPAAGYPPGGAPTP